MEIKNWLTKKSQEKSASNIIDGLRPLAAAVRADFDGAAAQSSQVSELTEALEQGRALSETELARQTQAMESWRARKSKVIEAQKKLFQDISLWSSLTPERSFTEVILPALYSGELISQSEPCFEPVIVAAYRVCEAAAKQRGVALEAYTSSEIIQIVEDAGDLYK